MVMTRQVGMQVIAGVLISLSLLGCGEAPPSSETAASPTAQESSEPMESTEPKADGHGHGSHSGHSHSMEPFVIPEGDPVPTVDLVVKSDPMAGWNVQVKAENFTFAPEELNNPGDWNAGHAHLYLDGKKVARLYGPWFHLTGVKPGERELRVTLNTNDHKDLKAGDQMVEAIAKFTVPTP